MQGMVARPLPPSNSYRPKNRKSTAHAWWGRGQQELRHRANGSRPSLAASGHQLLPGQGPDSTVQLQQQAGCQGHAAQPDRWAACWLVQRGAWGEWAVLAVKAGSGPLAAESNKCVSWGKTACKFVWGAGETWLLRGSTNSMYLSGHIISTVSGSWERSLLKQPGGWTMSVEPPTKHAHAPSGREAAGLPPAAGAAANGGEPNLPSPANLQPELVAGWCHSLGFSWWERIKCSLVGVFAQQELRGHARGGFWTSLVPLRILGGGSRTAAA